MNKPIAIFTVDVEEYFHARNLSAAFPRENWDKQASRVLRNVQRILSLMKAYGAHGTFFVLGLIAERFPELVREISAGGHEIGSHGYNHIDIAKLTQEQFRHDVRKTKMILESITGQSIISYRAPCFSISRETMWAIKIISEEGYLIDSSIFPVRRIAYGIHDSSISPYIINNDGKEIREYPLAVYRFFNINIPISGGGYLRIYPWKLYNMLLSHRDKIYNWPFIFYVHPWEIDPEIHKIDLSKVTYFKRWKHFVGINRTEEKLKYILERYTFKSISGYTFNSK